MSRSLPLAASLLVACCLGCAAQAADTVYPPAIDSTPGAGRTAATPDQQFVDDAAHGGLFEVQSSQVALTKSVPGPVHDFANHMINDHTTANDRLATLAKAEGYVVPSQPDAMQRDCLARLNAANGDAFVKEYDNAQRKAHDQAITAFQTEAQHGQDAKLRSFASDTLPTLRHHRDMVNSLPDLDEAPVSGGADDAGMKPQDTETPPGAGGTQSKSAPLTTGH